MSRFQFVRYEVSLDTLGRCFFERFQGGMSHVYRWRFALGPFEIRRWQSNG